MRGRPLALAFGAALLVPLLSGCDGGGGQAGLSAPSSLEAEGLDGAVQLNWSAPGEGVEGYRVYRDTSSGFTVSEAMPISGEAPIESSSYEDTGVSNATTYHYRVTAVGDGGESESTGAVDATPMPAPPARPN